MASKWSTEPYSSPSSTTSLPHLQRPVSDVHTTSLISLLNTSATSSHGPSRTEKATEGKDKSTNGERSPPASTEEVFSHTGEDSVERAEGKGRKLNATGESKRPTAEVPATPSSSPATERFFSSPEAPMSPQSPRYYSKHAPADYRYQSSSPSTSPRAQLASLPPSTLAPVSPPVSRYDENLPRERQSLPTDQLLSPSRRASGHDALDQKKPAPLPHVPVALLKPSSPSSTPPASPIEKVFSLEKQLRTAHEDVTRLRQQRNELTERIEQVNQAAQEDRLALAQAEKAVSSSRNDVEQLRTELARREEELHQARRDVEHADQLTKQAVREIVVFEDRDKSVQVTVDQVRGAAFALQETVTKIDEEHLELKEALVEVEREKDEVAARLAQAEDDRRSLVAQHQQLEVKADKAGRERDAYKAMLVQSEDALREARSEAKEARDEIAHLRSEQRSSSASVAIGGNRKADDDVLRWRLETVAKEEEDVVAQLDVSDSHLFSVERDFSDALKRIQEVEIERDAVKEQLAVRTKRFKELWDNAKAEKEAAIAQLQMALAAEKENARNGALGGEYPRFASPSSLLDLAESPKINNAAFADGTLPLEISVEKPEATFPLQAPAKQLTLLNQAYLKLQIAHRACSTRIRSLTYERASLKSHLAEAEREKEESYKERDEVYAVLQDLLETTAGLEEVRPPVDVLHPSTSFLSTHASTFSRPSSSLSSASTAAAHFGTARAGSACSDGVGVSRNALGLDGGAGERRRYEEEERRVDKLTRAEAEEEEL
ncbi:hypothetical protein JCM11251_005438 [Rhodosporidiobolus azoricus]